MLLFARKRGANVRLFSVQQVKMNLDLKIENNATINLSTNEDGSTSVDFSGIKAGKGFVKVGLPTVKIKGDEGTILGITVPLTK